MMGKKRKRVIGNIVWSKRSHNKDGVNIVFPLDCCLFNVLYGLKFFLLFYENWHLFWQLIERIILVSHRIVCLVILLLLYFRFVNVVCVSVDSESGDPWSQSNRVIIIRRCDRITNVILIDSGNKMESLRTRALQCPVQILSVSESLNFDFLCVNITINVIYKWSAFRYSVVIELSGTQSSNC